MFSHFTLTIVFCIISTQAQYAPGVPPPRGGEIKFHEPKGPSSPPPAQPGHRSSPPPSSEPNEGRGPPPKARQRKINHKDINVNLDREREHIKKQVKQDYMKDDISNMDDTRLLMQYF